METMTLMMKVGSTAPRFADSSEAPVGPDERPMAAPGWTPCVAPEMYDGDDDDDLDEEVGFGEDEDPEGDDGLDEEEDEGFVDDDDGELEEGEDLDEEGDDEDDDF